MNTSTKQSKRVSRHARVRSKIKGTSERPRVAVFKSNRNLFVQVIDDTLGKTLVSNTVKAAAKKEKGSKTEKASAIGKTLAGQMKEKGITAAVFDRGGFKYHGRIKALAEGLREGGVKI